MKLSAAAILSLAGLASAEVYIKEQFDDVSSFGSTPTRNGSNFSTTIKSDSPGHFFQSDSPDRPRGSTSAVAFGAMVKSIAPFR